MASIVSVLGLTALLKLTRSAVFFYLLFPGEAVSLSITGGHGVSNLKEHLGEALSLVVNILAYFAIYKLSAHLKTVPKD
jgi:hypothetical protein